MRQENGQNRWCVVFEWTVTRGSLSATRRCVRRAKGLPEVIPLPSEVRTALSALALPEEAQRVARAVRLRLRIPAETIVRCTHLGALKQHAACAAGWCNDTDAAVDAFEPDPFLWPETQGKSSHRDVAALWTWTDAAVEKHWIAFARLNNVASNGQAWAQPPSIFSDRAETLLREKADDDARIGKARITQHHFRIA